MGVEVDATRGVHSWLGDRQGTVAAVGDDDQGRTENAPDARYLIERLARPHRVTAELRPGPGRRRGL